MSCLATVTHGSTVTLIVRIVLVAYYFLQVLEIPVSFLVKLETFISLDDQYCNTALSRGREMIV